MATDFLRNLLAPYTGGIGGPSVPSSLADISGFNFPEPDTGTQQIGSAVGAQGLVSQGGVTLQAPAMQALLSALGRYGYRPGVGELGLFGPLSTYRTYAQQRNLYASKPGVAAPPGQSYHQQGLAIDVPAALQTAKFFALLRALGWNQLPSESWHWSYGVTG